MNTLRIEKLAEAKSKLKSDFVGLDEIIDKIIDSITPWYLTPEVLERPTVVSLWGLTGTGKTSLIRKLVGYLGISEKSLFFDCGEQGGETDTKLFSEKLDDIFESPQIHESDPRFMEEDLKELGIDCKSPRPYTKMDPLDYTFVFDEFQYLRTKDPGSGEEELRPEGRAIWSLMDSGLVDINRYHYKVKSLMEYIEDLEFFSDEHPGVILKEGSFDKSMTPILKQQLSYYRWSDEFEDVTVEENPEESKIGCKVLFGEDLSFLARRLNILQKGLGFEVAERINEIKSLPEFVDYIKGYIKLISKPKVINCSKSLIFILGNLDEAFELTGEDLDPDIDADVYHEITSKVNCMDIKTALRRRFRDEQVGRMGNNLIIYPSLRRCDFEEIITREVSRITNRIKNTLGKDIEVSESLKKLIYSEGCFPIQGVRPLFSTINTIMSPLLSMVMMMDGDNEYLLGVNSTNFNVPKITVEVVGKNSLEVKSKEISLNLGALRSPDRCKKIGLQAIHEASHAVLYYLLTGKTPSAIVASNVFGDGGYMMNAIDTDSSTTSIHELQTDIIVSLAGYYGERYFFDKDKCSLGASSDISNVWTRLRDAFYNSGLSVPMKFSEPGVSSENEGLPFGYPNTVDFDIKNELRTYFYNLCKETKELIHQEFRAIKMVARELCKSRCLGVKEFKEITARYLTTLPQDPDEDYYMNRLNDYD